MYSNGNPPADGQDQGPGAPAPQSPPNAAAVPPQQPQSNVIGLTDNIPKLDPPEPEEDPNAPKTCKLFDYAKLTNLTPELEMDRLNEIALDVVQSIFSDTQTMSKWLHEVDDVLKLSLMTKEDKNTPYPKSANIKFPMITDACYKFHSRSYPELIKDNRVVKAEIVGMSNPFLDVIADGISVHMSSQLLAEDSNWEDGMDRLLVMLPHTGFVLKKIYYDPETKKPCFEVCHHKDFILQNDHTIKKLEDLRRITHILHVHPQDLVKMARQGTCEDSIIMEIMELYMDKQLMQECTLYEQHCYLDLDDDGLEEPYIVTVHKESNKTIRIVPRYEKDDIKFNKKHEVSCIYPIQYFTDYHFLPAPDGCFLSVGFGSLLLHMNETCNSIQNQLVDAGKFRNMQTGFMDSRIKIEGGQQGVAPGVLLKTKAVLGQQLKDGIHLLQFAEPSSVLYQLLGMMLQSAKDLTSSTDAMQGLQNATNVPATSMLAMIEQGIKLHSSIQRRLHAAEKKELQKLYEINRRYIDEEDYIEVLGPEYKQLPNIYHSDLIKIMPVSDPNMSSDAQRLAQAQALMPLMQLPGINKYEILHRYLTALNLPGVEKILPPSAQKALAAPPPDPKMLDVQAKAQHKDAEVKIKGRAQDLKEKEFVAKLAQMDAAIKDLQSKAYKNVKEADATEQNANTQQHAVALTAMKTKLDAIAQAHQQMGDHNVDVAKVALGQQELAQKQQNDHAQLAVTVKGQEDQKDMARQSAGQIDSQQTPESDNANAQQQQPSGSDNEGADQSMAAPSPDQGVPQAPPGAPGSQP